MGIVVKIKKYISGKRTDRVRKVTATALSLAIEYYLQPDTADPVFVEDARSSLRRFDDKHVCFVTQYVFKKVMKDMPLEKAVKSLLYG